MSLEFGKPTVFENCPTNSSGGDGIDDSNEIGLANPEAVDLTNPSYVINSYKTFVRSAAIDGQIIADNFIADIDKNEQIQSMYNTLGFVDEMLGIETQYFDLKQEALRSYFTSLLQRMEKYAKNFKESSENKSVLTWLYTKIKMRLKTVTTNTSLIVDLPEYLNEIEEQILIFRRNEIEVNVNDQQYSMNNEIQFINAFIENHILPELENILVEVSSLVTRMIDELFERQGKFTPQQDACSYENDTTQSQLMMQEDKMYAFKTLNALSTIKDTENEATDEWISDSDDFSAHLPAPLERRKHTEKYELFITQMSDIERQLNPFLESDANSLTNITRYIAQLKADLKDELQNGIIDSNDIDGKRDELMSLSEEQQSELQLSKELTSTFDIILAILNLRDVSINFYENLSVDVIIKLLNLYEFTKQMEEEANEANKKIENIYDTILEQFLKMEASVKQISRQIINKSHFELDKCKWDTVVTIRDVKAVFRKFGNDTSVMEILCRSIDKLDDTIRFLFETYDTDYLNKAKSVNGFVDILLNNALKNLEKIIQMNIIREKYVLAVTAFNKQQFPFANTILMSDLQLPTDLQPDDNEKLVQVLIDRLYYLKEKIKSVDVLIGYDRLSDIEFSSEKSSFVGPFYKWTFPEEITEEKLKFLRGEEIELKATISMNSHFHAVKFNEIGIKITMKTDDEERQKYMTSLLEKCIVIMTMAGKDDYRCDKEIHSFEVDDNVRFVYSYKRNSNGQPLMKNDVYKKIYGKNYFLSPYTTWKVIVKQQSSADLTYFQQDGFVLELIGRGQYVEESDALSEICSDLKKI